jgi:hypothetical protein
MLAPTAIASMETQMELLLVHSSQAKVEFLESVLLSILSGLAPIARQVSPSI